MDTCTSVSAGKLMLADGARVGEVLQQVQPMAGDVADLVGCNSSSTGHLH